MVVAKRVVLSLLWVTTLTLIFARSSLGLSASLCDLKACLCPVNGLGRLSCDCQRSALQELILQPSGPGRLPDTTSTITIQNCEYVHITNNAFSALSGLTTINIQNINNLDLDENSFNWHHTIDEFKMHPGIKVNIMNTSIEEIPSYAFRGMIHSIHLKNCTIEDIQVFSFASLINTERIDIVDTLINNIQTQAFKKFTLNSFTIYNSRLPILPTRAMVDIEILSELRFEDVDFDVIRSSSIKVHGMQIFRLLNNRIVRLEKESFIINTKGSIIFQNNLIEDVMSDSLKEIKVDKRYLIEAGKQDFTFTNNSIVSFEDNPFSFNTTNFAPRIEQFNVLMPCSCTDTKKWITKSLLSYVHTKEDGTTFKEVVPEMSSLTNCKNSNNKNIKDLISVKLYVKSVCQENNYKKYLIILVLIVAFILIVLGIIFLIFKNRMKRYINVPTTNGSDNKTPYLSTKSNKTPIMVVPEGKTYRETELHVIVEQAEPIVEYIPPHKYEK